MVARLALRLVPMEAKTASVGILQALANSGVIGLSSAVFVLFGQNIGTCITAVLASIGTSRSAKRATIIHLMFNVIGGADVGAHDDPNRLIQCHHPGVDKAHHHNCGGRGGLDHRGDRRTYQYAQETVCRQPLQNLLHPAAGCRLQAGTHHLHSV